MIVQRNRASLRADKVMCPQANIATVCGFSFTAAFGGEFNRSVQHQLQSIGRGFEGQGLSRALIEPQSNAIG